MRAHLTGVLIAAGLALSACGGDAEGLSSVAAGESLAALAVIDTSAAHRPLTAEVFTEAVDGQPLDEGDTVQTDETGFAEVRYADGSLTRLDALTEFSVIALDGDVTVPGVTVKLEVGRVWNRVNTVTGERGRFEVETAVGVAAVRGTAFSVACTDEPVCTFAVTEGLVVVRLLNGGEIEIAAGEAVTIGLEDVDGAPPGGGATDGGSGAGTGGDGGADGGTTTDGSTDGTDGAGDGTATGGTGTGATSGTGGTSDDGGRAGVRGVVLGRSPLGTASGANGADASTATGGDAGTGGPTGGTEVLGVWLARNDPLDTAVGRFVDERESCSVSVNGRNIAYATTPDTAIQAPIEETLKVDAVATGELDRYRVDLAFAGISVKAAEGDVQADASGDRTTFRGDVDVSRYAQWGVGLYEVTATTTGTVCEASAFVEVTGRSPLTTGAGITALLLVLGGTAGLVAAINTALGGGSATIAPSGPSAPTDPTIASAPTTSGTFSSTPFLPRTPGGTMESPTDGTSDGGGGGTIR